MFYTYDQNNSGGSFVSDGSVTYTVIVEANSAEDANDRAERIGLYFNGCDSGQDCPCCGDRWHPESGDGDAAPKIYGEPAAEYKETFAAKGSVYCYIYYMDGRKEELRKP